MMVLTVAVIFVIVFALIAVFTAYTVKKGATGLKIMLYGINITLLGGIIAVDPDSNLGGIEYLIAISGLLISFLGLLKKD